MSIALSASILLFPELRVVQQQIGVLCEGREPLVCVFAVLEIRRIDDALALIAELENNASAGVAALHGLHLHRADLHAFRQRQDLQV